MAVQDALFSPRLRWHNISLSAPTEVFFFLKRSPAVLSFFPHFTCASFNCLGISDFYVSFPDQIKVGTASCLLSGVNCFIPDPPLVFLILDVERSGLPLVLPHARRALFSAFH